MRRAIAAAIAVTLSALLVGLTAGSAQAYVKSATYQKQILARTNEVREANDRVKVKTTKCLGGYADAWAKHLATKESALVHRSSASLTTIMKKCKLDGIGENLAWGYGTGTAVVNAWQKSPGHRANQLGKGYRHIGIGAYRDAGDRYFSVALYGNPA
jgi:uncharacterized protein YkwD